ncbi:macro domain-containing protein [Planococcus lenghuensis]|uniref:RNase III inhibitor n=1 Tax=Planococcus lenghuensis TaxID=2213202 RepID=A0A1Q2KX21_9BACL|nr:macro domain-containing protein [Planococcus lenghuensis]AQQ52367.1 RNase III inhibitor [Planococcus lenghuensis]
MPLELIRNDITNMKADAIVNPVDADFRADGGVSAAIFKAAGERELRTACREFGRLAIGEAVRTASFQLPAKHIIHTTGPVWQGGREGEDQQLRNCYRNALRLAVSLGCESIAFPLISTGLYGYPKDRALRMAVAEIHEFLLSHELSVYIAVYDRAAFQLSGRLFRDVQSYIDEHYIEEREYGFARRSRSLNREIMLEESVQESIDELFGQLDESFSVRLMRLIDERDLKDPLVYKRANIDRKLFSKIRSSPDYTPRKTTALALAIALELNLQETADLLESAGYALSRSSRADVIIMYFIEAQNYDIFEINEVLFAHEQKLLGAS